MILAVHNNVTHLERRHNIRMLLADSLGGDAQ